MLKIGERAPDFELADQSGKKVRLSDFKGKNVVVYFYPKDDTPGCTVEACEFRDWIAEYQKRGVVVLGISADGTSSHQKFVQKYDLNFQLLSDTDKSVSTKWGTWGMKTFLGKSSMGMLRTTFLIGADGNVLAVFEKVKPEGHAKQILASL